MQREEFLDKVTRLAPFSDKEQAEHSVQCSLRALAMTLEPDAARAVAAELPESFAARLRPAGQGYLEPGDFFSHLASLEGVSEGFAREHATVILSALSQALSPEARKTLGAGLPERLRELLEARPSRRAPAHVVPSTEARNSIADGRPGSRHPLSEARPERAHRNSVASTDAPHGDAMLSTARGLTQERERDTLAEGRPGSETPVHSSEE